MPDQVKNENGSQSLSFFDYFDLSWNSTVKLYNFVLSEGIYDFVLADSVVFSCLGDALRPMKMHCFRTTTTSTEHTHKQSLNLSQYCKMRTI